MLFFREHALARSHGLRPSPFVGLRGEAAVRAPWEAPLPALPVLHSRVRPEPRHDAPRDPLPMSRLLRFVAPSILAFLALTACTTTRTVYVDRPVEVERTRWVPIDPGLTARKPIPEPRTDSGREVLRVASERKADLKACYADKASIEAVQGTEVTP